VDKQQIQSIVQNDSQKLRLINVWATWCAPCIEELPELVTMHRMYRGREFEMVTVSADKASDLDKATELLKSKNVSCRNVLFATEKQDELFETIDPQWQGGLPYTVLVAPGGKVVYRKQGQIDPVALKKVIADSVGRTFASDDVSISEKVGQLSDDDVAPGENFKTENLIPWCMVAFDAKERSPEQRAQMIIDLGMKRSAYAWRPKHLPEFEREIEAYKKHGIEYRAFFNWHQSMEPLIKKHGIKPEIWHYMEESPTGTQQEKIEKIAAKIMPIVDKTRQLGLKFALYNHRGWTGEPANMIAVIEHIKATQPDSDHLGIVYNFHHGHGDIADFESRFKSMLPYLVCVNLNGMVLPEFVDEKSMKNKILTIGEGTHEQAMIRTVINSGYSGPIGIINHRNELDAKTALQDNIDGLQQLLKRIQESD
jgi:thiol-disulfide isomerase/thioredoxin